MNGRSRAGALLLLLLAAACSEKPRAGASGASSATPSVSPASSAVDAALPANARAALTKPAGATAEDLAVVAAQDVVRRDGDKLDGWVALGHAWLRKARATDDQTFYVNADACASVVLAKDADHAAAADVRAHALARRREYTEARQLAERITARHPNEPSGWANLLDALLELGRYEEAKDAARKMLELGPSSPAYRRTARIQWLHGDVAGAKESLRLALDASTNDPEAAALAFVESGMISWHEGDYASADAAFGEARERVANFGPALAGKGRVAMARGNFARAVDLLRRSYEVRPALETAWLLGNAREAAGDPKGAEDSYALVTKDGAANDPLVYSVFLSTKKDAPKVERSDALRLAADVHVKQFDVYTEDALAWALHRAGMTDAAKTAMGRARRLSTPDARILFHEGAIRLAAGDSKKGREVVAKALALNPAFDWREAKEARGLLTR